MSVCTLCFSCLFILFFWHFQGVYIIALLLSYTSYCVSSGVIKVIHIKRNQLNVINVSLSIIVDVRIKCNAVYKKGKKKCKWKIIKIYQTAQVRDDAKYINYKKQ